MAKKRKEEHINQVYGSFEIQLFGPDWQGGDCDVYYSLVGPALHMNKLFNKQF